MLQYKGYLMFDFDSVIATYTRPWEFDKLGSPVASIRNVMKHYYDKGYWIGLFTGRMCTPKLKKWLKDNNFKYHAINRQPPRDPNLCDSRFKPYFDIIFDDKAINFHYKHNYRSAEELIEEVERIMKINKEGK